MSFKCCIYFQMIPKMIHKKKKENYLIVDEVEINFKWSWNQLYFRKHCIQRFQKINTMYVKIYILHKITVNV